MSELLTHKLSDRPNWWVPRLFMCLAIVSAVVSLVAWLMSLWLYSMVTFDVMALGAGGEEIKSSFIEMSAVFLEETSILLFETLFFIGFLWLLAIAIDKIDQLVWLNASYEDQLEIIAKRKKKNNAE